MHSLALLAKVLTASMAITLLSMTATSSTTFGQIITPPNPFLGKPGLSTMHGDAASSDTTSYPGPGTGKITATRHALQAACPTLLGTSDSMLFGLCTSFYGRTPTIFLFSLGAKLDILAKLAITRGSLLGGCYAYVDQEDRLVVTDGKNELLRVAKRVDPRSGKFSLHVVDTLSLASAIGNSDFVVGLTPDWHGHVWFATAGGLVGYADPQARNVVATGLRASINTTTSATVEEVANSISSSPAGTAVTTTHATYLLVRDDTLPEGIRTVWRQPYDRGPARKPGQLSWGSGSTPTFFGPVSGYEYTTIVDNATPLVNLLIYQTLDGSLVCKVPLFAAFNAGSENSPIASGRSVFVASTFGYPYPTTPAGTPPSQPASATFIGGMVRVDIADDERLGCSVVWENYSIRSSALPKLSLSEGRIYTIARHAPLFPDSNRTSIIDNYYYMTVNAENGSIETKQRIGTGFLYDTLQMAGLTMNDTFFQGTLTGIVQIKKA
ncbi:hypothetical protein BGW42_006552 [Actinomortierella wolfii]|nr:hypothetical protein BGW42_006552 [Actinomortierella wolfii]